MGLCTLITLIATVQDLMKSSVWNVACVLAAGQSVKRSAGWAEHEKGGTCVRSARATTRKGGERVEKGSCGLRGGLREEWDR